jgi:hypothetical protein
LGKTRIILGVDDGVLAAGQGDAAEGVAVPDAAIDQRQSDADLREPKRDGYGYGNVITPLGKIKEQKAERKIAEVLRTLSWTLSVSFLSLCRAFHLPGPFEAALYYWGDAARSLRKKRDFETCSTS